MDKEIVKIIQPIMEKLRSLEELLTEIKEELVKMNEEADILKQYQPADIDDAGTVKYYGFVKKNGDWIIEQEDTVNKTYRFAKSSELWRKTEEEKDYANAWANRANLQYFYFYEIF
jgi:hypothetical protein